MTTENETQESGVKLLKEAIRLQKEGVKLSEAHANVLKEHGIYLQKNTKYYKEQLASMEKYEAAMSKRTTLETDLTEQINLNNQMEEARLRIQETQIRGMNEVIDKVSAQLDKQKEIQVEALKEELQIKRLLKLQDKQKKGARLTSAEKKEQLKLQKKLNDLYDTSEATLEEIQKAAKKRKEDAIEAGKVLRDEVRETEDLLGVEHERYDIGKKTQKANEGIRSGTQNILKTFLGVTDQSNTFLGSLIESRKATGSWAEGFAKTKESMKEMLNPQKLGMMLLLKIFESTIHFMKEFDQLAGDFRKNTGIIEKGLMGVEQQIVNVQRSLITQGITLKEAFAAQTALNESMAGFNFMTRKSQQRVLKVTALMAEFGANAQTTAKIMNGLDKGLGMNVAQLEKTSLELMELSVNLRVPAKIISEDYAKAMPELMKYGDGMTEVFEGLAEQSKETGIAMNELLGIAKQFDTFEDAGNAVGRLNAILGGPYLNAIQMVYATEEERIKQMRDAIRMGGRQFKDLGRFEQQAIAAAAGIKDLQVANQLFNSTDADFEERAMSMKEMQERAAQAQSTMDKFRQVMISFAIALTPLVDVLGALASALLFVLNPVGQISKFFGADSDLVAGIGAVTTGIYMLVAAQYAMGKGWLAAMGPILPFVAAIAGVVAILELFGPGARIAIGLAVALGAAFAIMAAIPSGGVSVAGFVAAATASPITAGIAIGGLVGMASGLTNYRKGKRKGEGGGIAFAGEQDSGIEGIHTADGGNYLVENTVVDLGRDDTVFSGAQTAGMLGGGGDGQMLAAAIAEMSATLPDLIASAVAAQMPEQGGAMASAPPATIKLVLNGRELAEAQMPTISRELQTNPSYGLSLTRGTP